ncbi:hypothetical protein [Microtetraspora sp. NBRC 13810]|uniref:hypothetical protein n=1 Tax=Microtetraspora sp. NBRC 13810 TaxID=3030990 RepID=UPI0025533A72|nr:hypothetical protein [Microtetraspora sp. NBRC 13810]
MSTELFQHHGDGVAEERAANLLLFQAVHEVATGYAGRQVPAVLAALRRHLPAAPGLDAAELLRIAEEISVGRDPSGI